ncbi:MAG: PD-(D/E)XK nuclease family protein [Defluviitaleaceae bacterium]|nr:PD-(D/E)XK nuclease family protein [Defluviitaleaceae bacterium]
MALQFITGPPGSGKTTHCLAAINREVPGTAPLYYLVPEQFSLQSERLILQDRAAMIRVQVLSFNRMAYRLFGALGGPPGRLADDLAKAMLLRKILIENADALQYYQSAHDKPGFVDALAATLTELNHYRVTASDLLARVEVGGHAASFRHVNVAATINTDPVLNTKLADLALLLRKYREAVDGQFLLTDDMMDLLCARIEAHDGDIPLLDGAFIWVDGFSGFTPQERAVLVLLAKRAAYMGITLTTRDTPNTPPRIDPLCAAPRHTQAILTRDVKRALIPVHPPIHMPSNHRHAANPALAFFVERYAVRSADLDKNAFPGATPITIHPAANPYAAVLTAAAVVHDWTTQRSYQYSDIAIVCGDRSRYEKILQTAFDRVGIPLFIDTEISILPHPLTELIRAAFDIVIRNHSYESVFRFLKTGLTNIAPDDIDRLENYALAQGLNGFRWQYPLRDPQFEVNRSQLATILKFIPRAEKKDTVLSFARAVFNMLDALEVPTTLARKFDEAMAAGDTATARLHKQIWPKICEVFDKLVEVLGDTQISTRDFAALLDAGLTRAGLGRIPPTLNQVVLGDAMRSRYPKLKAMIVLGANDGILPPTPAAPGLFTDDERERLRNSDLELAADLTDRLNENHYALFCTLAQPTEALAFITAEAEADGKPLRPAPILQTLRTLFPALKPTTITPAAEFAPLPTCPASSTMIDGLSATNTANSNVHQNMQPMTFADTTYNDIISSREDCNDNAAAASNMETPIQRTNRMHDMAMLALHPSSAAAAFGPVLYTTASRLEAYARCPFAYFVTYLLRARPRKLYEVLPTDLGNLFHGAVALFAERHGWSPRTKTEIDALVLPLVEELTAEDTTAYHGSARNRHILEKARRVCTTSIWALTAQIETQIHTDAYTPTYSEIDLPAAPPLRTFNQRDLHLSGRIDRVDIRTDSGTNYVKIIDYKSGTARFHPDDVRTGTRLQLPLYLNAMLHHPDIPNARPGGLYYFPIDDPLIKTDEPLSPTARDAALVKAFKPSGIEPDETLLHQANETTRTLATKLTDGLISATPCPTGGKLPCEYCLYTAACGVM